MFMEEYASYSQRARLLSKRTLLFLGQRLTLTLSTRPQLASTRSRRGTAAPPPSTSPRRCGAHRPPCRGTVVFAQCYTAKDVPRCWSVLRAPCERGRARALNARLARAAGRGRRRRLQHAEPAKDRQDWQRGGCGGSLSAAPAARACATAYPTAVSPLGRSSLADDRRLAGRRRRGQEAGGEEAEPEAPVAGPRRRPRPRAPTPASVSGRRVRRGGRLPTLIADAH